MSKTTRVLGAAGRGLGKLAVGSLRVVGWLASAVLAAFAAEAAGGAKNRPERCSGAFDEEELPAIDPGAPYTADAIHYDENGVRLW